MGYESAMVNVKPKILRSTFTMRVEPGDFFRKLDDLRAVERPVLTRSDMVRKLVDDAHDKAQGSRQRGKR